MNRQDAINAGALLYDPSRPCARGHTSKRYVKSGACLECLQEDKDARHLAATGHGPLTISFKCHPDDAQVLVKMHEHLVALRRLQPTQTGDPS